MVAATTLSPRRSNGALLVGLAPRKTMGQAPVGTTEKAQQVQVGNERHDRVMALNVWSIHKPFMQGSGLKVKTSPNKLLKTSYIIYLPPFCDSLRSYKGFYANATSFNAMSLECEARQPRNQLYPYYRTYIGSRESYHTRANEPTEGSYHTCNNRPARPTVRHGPHLDISV